MTDLIEQIARQRYRNNSYWMELLRIAYECDPDQTKEVLRKLNEGDKAVSELVRKLAE